MNTNRQPQRTALAGLFSLALLLQASADEPIARMRELTAHHPPSTNLLERNTIQVVREGTFALDVKTATDLLMRDDLLDRVQAAYGELLPAGETPEFVVRPVGSNAWSFVNQHGQQSEIHQVAQVMDPAGNLTVVFYARGERFFGLFESLTAVRATPLDDERMAYEVCVLAYPRQPVFRFIIRHLGLVERYFRNKTEEMEAISMRICRRLCAAESSAPEDA